MHTRWMMRRPPIYLLVGPLLAWGWLQAGEMGKPAGKLVLTLSSTVAPGGGMGRTVGAVDPERPTNTLMLENNQAVLIVVTVTAAIEQTDVRILPSESGVTMKLRE